MYKIILVHQFYLPILPVLLLFTAMICQS